MNVQDEIKSLKQRIAELEELAKEEQEFPQYSDLYWFVDDEGVAYCTVYEDHHLDKHRQSIGNFFQTKEEAEFASEKLKVEAELRKFSRPFEYGENNHIICVEKNINRLFTIGRLVDHYQGAIYFESKGKAEEAIRSVGAERIEKYIFGVED
ncbi:hypothetical protein [Aerococcus urinaeequi]|uniref:hypothetical protein n=1 Tax=Aerococcus urinaeequi TaxID=51665 RepID=UPI00367126F5